MKKIIYSEKKIKLLQLVIILSLIYSTSLAILDILGITQYIEYRAPLMTFYAISNVLLLYTLKRSQNYINIILYVVLFLALFVFTTTMIIYPTSEIRVMWYFFTIVIAYYIGSNRVGHITAISSVIILLIINSTFSLGFSNPILGNMIIGILFISQISNYFINILNKNEQELIESNFKVNELLNNAGQGFLYFDYEMKIGEQYSKEAKRVFNDDIEHKDITKLLYPFDEEERAFFEETLKDILNEDEFKQEILISLLPNEFKINNKFISIEYKVLDKENFMMILTDITSKKDLAQKIKDEQQVLKMVVEIVTSKEQFMEIKSDYEKFTNRIEEFKSLDYLSSLRREAHTYKGLFAQKEMLNIVKKLHAFETIIDNSLKSQQLDIGIQTLTTKEMDDWLALDLDIIKDILGEEYFSDTGYVSVNMHRIDQLYKKINRYLGDDKNKGKITNEIENLKYNNIKIFFRSYGKLIKQLSEKFEKPMNEFDFHSDNIYLSDRYIPFINSLVHIFRNSMDHGIEDLEQRYESQKEENGTIFCNISHKNNFLNIEISDDGRGIDEEKIKTLAIEKGIYTQEKVDNLTQQEVLLIIFKDAFSTSETITDISGRGVGLASLLEELNNLNGKITIENKFKKGVKFMFEIPMELK